MKAAALFGYKSFDYMPYRDRIERILGELIEREGVELFYNDDRGSFNYLCSKIISEKRRRFPRVRNLLIADGYAFSENCPTDFCDRVCEIKTLDGERYSGMTKRRIVMNSDYIVFGIASEEVESAYEYCFGRDKRIINIFVP